MPAWLRLAMMRGDFSGEAVMTRVPSLIETSGSMPKWPQTALTSPGTMMFSPYTLTPVPEAAAIS